MYSYSFLSSLEDIKFVSSHLRFNMENQEKIEYCLQKTIQCPIKIATPKRRSKRVNKEENMA